MDSFLEDAENALHHRASYGSEDGSGSEESSGDSLDDPFLYDKFLVDPKYKKEEVEEPKPKPLVDPGPFRYNTRVFVTSLPAICFILALGGETLVLVASVSTAIVTLVSQTGDSKRCIVAILIFFIPTHLYIIGTVLPLLWLSTWHILLVMMINAFVLLMGFWILIQFAAFRMEETFLATTFELLLFTLLPFTAAAIVSWAFRLLYIHLIREGLITIMIKISWVLSF